MAAMKENVHAPSTLTMRLFAPGMSALHRAGLGGLAATLRHIKQAAEHRELRDDEIPGGPWRANRPPWSIETDSITIDFGESKNAREFLRRLFVIGFQVKSGLIYLPGQHRNAPIRPILADLHNGLTLTFLQHGKTRKPKSISRTEMYDPETTGAGGVAVEYKPCEWFKHQDGWKELAPDGSLSFREREVVGDLCPGSMVRHVAYTAQTKWTDPPHRLLPLYFGMVGCMAIPINRGMAALIVPEVTDLIQFAAKRPLMTPTSSKECQIASAADGALQAQVRLRSSREANRHDFPGCYAMTLRPTPWAKQVKSRVATVSVEGSDDRVLEHFEIALNCLPPKVRALKPSTKSNDPPREIRVDSVLRPLIAENLAAGRAWYIGFRDFAAKQDGKTSNWKRITFERKGLSDMIGKIPRAHAGEERLINAMHRAIQMSLGRIREETDGRDKRSLSAASKNRFNRFQERLRLSLLGAKTKDQCRAAICNLFGRAGKNEELQTEWRDLLPLLCDPREWQKARDLALLALASYSGKESIGESTDASSDDSKGD